MCGYDVKGSTSLNTMTNVYITHVHTCVFITTISTLILESLFSVCTLVTNQYTAFVHRYADFKKQYTDIYQCMILNIGVLNYNISVLIYQIGVQMCKYR